MKLIVIFWLKANYQKLTAGFWVEFKILLVDKSTPLVSALLPNEFKACGFIQAPRRTKSFESPKICPLVALAPTKIHCAVDKLSACPFAPQSIGYDEPPQMSPFIFSMNTVYDNRTFDPTILRCEPDSVTVRIKSPQKHRKFGSDLCLKIKPKPPILMVIGPVKFGNATDCTGNISDFYENFGISIHGHPCLDDSLRQTAQGVLFYPQLKAKNLSPLHFIIKARTGKGVR